MAKRNEHQKEGAGGHTVKETTGIKFETKLRNVTFACNAYTKSSKPMMEKRRRARINASLIELKSLLMNVIRREQGTTRHSKMEKADILELAVAHLRQVHKQLKDAADSSATNRYRMGFNACIQEVSNFLLAVSGEDVDLRTKLLNHLACYLTEKGYEEGSIAAEAGKSGRDGSNRDQGWARVVTLPPLPDGKPSSNRGTQCSTQSIIGFLANVSSPHTSTSVSSPIVLSTQPLLSQAQASQPLGGAAPAVFGVPVPILALQDGDRSNNVDKDGVRAPASLDDILKQGALSANTLNTPIVLSPMPNLCASLSLGNSTEIQQEGSPSSAGSLTQAVGSTVSLQPISGTPILGIHQGKYHYILQSPVQSSIHGAPGAQGAPETPTSPNQPPDPTKEGGNSPCNTPVVTRTLDGDIALVFTADSVHNSVKTTDQMFPILTPASAQGPGTQHASKSQSPVEFATPMGSSVLLSGIGGAASGTHTPTTVGLEHYPAERALPEGHQRVDRATNVKQFTEGPHSAMSSSESSVSVVTVINKPREKLVPSKCSQVCVCDIAAGDHVTGVSSQDGVPKIALTNPVREISLRGCSDGGNGSTILNPTPCKYNTAPSTPLTSRSDVKVDTPDEQRPSALASRLEIRPNLSSEITPRPKDKKYSATSTCAKIPAKYSTANSDTEVFSTPCPSKSQIAASETITSPDISSTSLHDNNTIVVSASFKMSVSRDPSVSPKPQTAAVNLQQDPKSAPGEQVSQNNTSAIFWADKPPPKFNIFRPWST